MKIKVTSFYRCSYQNPDFSPTVESRISQIRYFFKVQFVIIVLVRPNCRWDPFAFLFVQGVVNNGPVVEGSLARIFIGVYHGVFAPVLIHGQCLLSFNWFWVVIFIHTVLVVLPVIDNIFHPGIFKNSQFFTWRVRHEIPYGPQRTQWFVAH